MKHIFPIITIAILQLILILICGFTLISIFHIHIEPIQQRDNYAETYAQVQAAANVVTSDIANMKAAYERAQWNNRYISISEVEQPQIGDQLGRISVEKAGIDIPLYFGDTDAILHRGAGMYAGGALPGFLGLTMLCSHNGASQFGPLDQVEVGDSVDLTMPYGDYSYTINEIKVVNAKDSTAYDFNVKDDELIVYTCYPTYYNGSTSERLFLYCKKATGPTVLDD